MSTLFESGHVFTSTIAAETDPTWQLILKECNTKQTDLGGENEILMSFLIVPGNGSAPFVQFTTRGVKPFGYWQAQLVQDLVIPPIGSKLEDAWEGLYVDDAGGMWASEARLRDYSLIQGELGTLTLQCRFSTMYQKVPVICTLTYAEDTLVLPTSVESTTTFRQVMMFRDVNQAPPNDGVIAPYDQDYSAADIAGVANTPGTFNSSVTYPGMPYDVPQLRIRIRLTQDTTNTVEGITDSMQQFLVCAGMRNSETFLGLEAGKIWCDGVAFQPLKDNFYEVVFDFVIDQFWEHSQVADQNGDGTPTFDEFGKAETVLWIRPVRQAVDFNEVFNGNLQVWENIQEGWWKLFNNGEDKGLLAEVC
jgi:hypothetical protein